MTRIYQPRPGATRRQWLAFLARLVLVSIMGMLMSVGVAVVLFVALSGPAHADGLIPRAAQQHRLQLRQAAHMAWGLNAPVAVFAAQLHQESRWRTDARSPVGALGMAQFMPATAQWIGGLDQSLAARSPTNPAWAIRALVVYDRWLWDRITRAIDDCERMAFTLSAYNGGLGWVYKRQRRSGMPAVCLGQTCTLNPGITPEAQAENERYPVLILGRHQPLYSTWGPGLCNGHG